MNKEVRLLISSILRFITVAILFSFCIMFKEIKIYSFIAMTCLMLSERLGKNDGQ